VTRPRKGKSGAEPHAAGPRRALEAALDEAAVGKAVTEARATALLVEDEAAVRAVVERMLTSAGYAVVAAPGWRQALDAAGELGDALDLLVTDVVMPEVGGPELAKRLRETRPGLPVLYISGYVPGPHEPGRDDPLADFVGKPFGSRELLDAAERVLDRARRAV
jgi:two-component system, cell cycle sensor histidine kinase and response regulator CckA